MRMRMRMQTSHWIDESAKDAGKDPDIPAADGDRTVRKAKTHDVIDEIERGGMGVGGAPPQGQERGQRPGAPLQVPVGLVPSREVRDEIATIVPVRNVGVTVLVIAVVVAVKAWRAPFAE